MKFPRLLHAVLVIVFCYAAFVVTFDVVLGQVIPASLLTMYMFFVVAGVFMVFTFTEESARELVAPIKALVEDPRRKAVRNVVFAVLPLAAGAYTYYNMLPSDEVPVERRTIHPAPPSTVKAFCRCSSRAAHSNATRSFGITLTTTTRLRQARCGKAIAWRYPRA